MGKEREASARIVVRAPVRANRSPRREAAHTRLCALHRAGSSARPTLDRSARPEQARGRRRARRTAHCARRQAGSGEGSDAFASRVNVKDRAVVARSFVMCGER